MGLVFNGTSGTDKISAVDGTLTIDGVATINSITSPIITGDLSISDTIVHTGDTNTKIRFSDADQISAETAGSERLRIRSDGRVQVKSGSAEVIAGEGVSAELRLTADEGDDGADYWKFQSNHSTNNLNIATYATGSYVDKITLTSAGLMGLGTNNPSRMLHVKSAGANATQIALIDNDSTNEVFQIGQQSDGDCFVSIRDDSGNTKISFDASGDSFFDGGKVGFGVAAPTGTLSVASGTWQSTTPESTGDDIVISGSNSLGMQFLTLASNTSNNNIYFGDTDDVDVGMIRYAHADNSMQFRTNATERLRIGSAGQIGLSGANYGSSGQVLTSQGGSAAPQWATAGGATVQSGSWTPAWTGHSGTPSAVDTAYGKYTRIGELVFIECYIKSGTRGSATGAIRVSGLPFDLRNDTHDQVLGAVAWDSSGSSIDYSGQNRADHVNMIAWIPNNTGYIRFAHQTNAEATAYRANNAGEIDLNWIICGSSSGNYLSFRFSGCYRTDA